MRKRPLTEAHKQKISMAKRGITTRKGFFLSEDHKRKIGLANSIALKGRHFFPINEFEKGHQPWNKGILSNEVTKQKIREKLLGYKHTEQARKNMSDAKKGFIFTEKHRKNISIAKVISGYSHSKETKEKIRHATLKQENFNRLGMLGKKHTFEWKKNMSEFHIAHPNKHFKNTSIEIKIQNELIENKIPFIKQTGVEKVAVVDFFLPDFNVVIQCDGCYWHNCLEHNPKHHIEARQRDITQTAKLEARGVKVFRFWEHDINKSPNECIKSVLNYLLKYQGAGISAAAVAGAKLLRKK